MTVYEPAQVVLATACLLLASAVLLLVWRRGLDRLAARVGPVTVEVDAVKRIAEAVEQINTAVNHVDPGEPPLIDRVRKIEHRLDLIVEHLGIDVP